MFTGGEEGGKNPLGEVKSLLAELTKGKVHKKAELDVTSATLTKRLKEAKIGVVARGQRENLRATPQQKNILANIMREVEHDFIEIDLKRDLGIKDPKKLEEFRMLFREYFTSKMSNEMMLEIAQSKEWEQLNNHVNEVAKYAKLDEIIATCKVEGNSGAWTVFAEKHPMLANVGSWLIGWYVGNKKEKDMTKFDKKLQNIAIILSGGEQKPDPNAPSTAPATTDKPEVAVKPDNLNEKQRTTIKPLVDVGFIIDLDTLKIDMDSLIKDNNYDDAKLITLAQKGAESSGQFYKVGKAILKKLGDKPINFKLSDIHVIEELSEGQIDSLTTVINKVESNPIKMREALDRTRQIKPNDGEDAIARHMQVDPKALTDEAVSNKGDEMG